MLFDHSFKVVGEFTTVPRNEIILNEEELERLGLVRHLFVEVIHGGKSVRCVLQADPSVHEGSVKLSKRSMETLGIEAPQGSREDRASHIAEVDLVKPPFDTVKRGIPVVDEIGRGYVRACPKLVEKFSEHVEILNPGNGFRVHLFLRASRNAKDKTVYLDRYTMLLLGIDPDKTKDFKLVISPCIRAVESAPAEGSVLLKRVRSIKKRMVKHIGEIFIGKRELMLRVAYLYPFDEHYSLARVHPNTRKFLGVEESDKIKVTYAGKEVVLPVLDIDPEHLEQVFKIEDKFIDGHLLIGLPATSRFDLSVPGIGTIVEVERSMKFLFLKHLNKLILPTLALWFTLLQITLKAVPIVVTTCVVVPLIIYTSLSEERAKISRKGGFRIGRSNTKRSGGHGL